MEMRYEFARDGAPTKSYTVHLDPETLESHLPPGEPPAWARLEHHQCQDCPLKAEKSPFCPVATRIAPLVVEFRDSISHDEADITVTAPGRSYKKRASMQVGVSGLFGLVMATSGCPILDRYRPMAFTHLPFPSLHEGMYRSMSMYLFAQYFVAQKGGAPDWSLDGLSLHIAQVGRVNVELANRLRPLIREDAAVNAVVNLDVFATLTAFAINKKSLHWLERLFKPYWDPTNKV